jgi:hypothetical protein
VEHGNLARRADGVERGRRSPSEGKEHSAMNALKSMMKATAGVRSGGVESEIPAE